jgi:hypothetical protein
MRRAAITTLLIFILGCSTEPPPTGSIRLEFSYQPLQSANDSLYPIFPNPFSRVSGDTALSIRFALVDTTSGANLLIQNALGDPVADFYDTLLPSGFYTGWWNPVASDGTALTSGIYFVTLQNGGFIYSRLVNVQENE